MDKDFYSSSENCNNDIHAEPNAEQIYYSRQSVQELAKNVFGPIEDIVFLFPILLLHPPLTQRYLLNKP